MKKIGWNNHWKCYRTGYEEEVMEVTLPHDAMLLDAKSETSAGGVNTGWYEANDYTYEKIIVVPKEYENQTVMLEFEGVYRNATVFVNETKVAYHEYGYTGFYVNLNGLLKPEQENIVKVEVINHDQPNSRWYSGTGIYRPVWLYLLPQNHILLDGIRVSTVDYQNPRIKVDIHTSGEGKPTVIILDEDKVMTTGECVSTWGREDGLQANWEADIMLPDATCWSPESPKMYTCKVIYGEDVQEVTFGIRTIQVTSAEGFCINGHRVILRGACIHHDNGLLGACAYDFAEKRKVRLVKENGYNAIRSAHNPCSKAMLDACDELGVLIVDEYVDVWYTHKTKYDYAACVERNYQEDLKAMVEKDYNHPSVVMYSTGNEVSESAQARGIKLCQEFTDYLHKLDDSRLVSCGINIFFNFLSAIGFGVYSDKKAEDAVKNAKKKKSVGSEFFNKLAGFAGADFMKFGATLYPCDLKTKDVFAAMDVAGYNYGIKRYRHDLKKYPQRLIMGSETFCSDAYTFWEIAKKEKRIIGDFVWSGIDYLGEVGIGSWEYPEYAKRFDQGMGWLTAGSGRIDITGKALSEMQYTQVAFEQKEIAIAVLPVAFAREKHSPSAWKMTSAMESWSWDGCEGMAAEIEVYCRAHHVSLYLNGTCIGTKQAKKDCKVVFQTSYHNGVLKAVGFDEQGEVIAEKTIATAEKETILIATPELQEVNANKDLCYVRFQYTDRNGTLQPMARGDIRLQVRGGILLGAGSGCPYYPRGYLSDTIDTYYGEAMCIIKPISKDGKCVLEAESPFGNCKVEIKVVS